MRIKIAVLIAALVTWNSLPSRAQENPVPTIVNEIDRLESERDPKCYATANRLEDFMYGTPLSFEARLEKIALQKDLILGIWSDASIAAAALDREKVSAAEIAPLTGAVLDRAESPTGAVVLVTPSGPSITLLADDVRQYGSVAYSLRAILAVEQESMLSRNTSLLPLDEGSVRALKDLLDVYTLATLQLADRQARMANEREISAERLVHAWRSLGDYRQKTTHPTLLTDRSDTGSSLQTLRELLAHALVNGIAAPFVSQGVGALLDRLGDDEASQRPIRLEPRTLSL